MAISDDAEIILLDVTALYTSIPLEDARSVVQHYLSQPNYKGPPIHFILQLVDLFLEKNYFKYEDEFYLRITGISMGSSFAPSLANLFMARMEDEFILNQCNNPFRQDIQMFWRFIDDCLCIFTERTKVNDFLEWLNNIQPSIVFTLESNLNETHFLDTIVYRRTIH